MSSSLLSVLGWCVFDNFLLRNCCCLLGHPIVYVLDLLVTMYSYIFCGISKFHLCGCIVMSCHVLVIWVVTDLSQSFFRIFVLFFFWNVCSKLHIFRVFLRVFSLYVDFIFAFFSCRLSVVTFLSRFLIMFVVLFSLYERLFLVASVIFSFNISSAFCISPCYSRPLGLFSFKACIFCCSSIGILMSHEFLLGYYFVSDCNTDFRRHQFRSSGRAV